MEGYWEVTTDGSWSFGIWLTRDPVEWDAYCTLGKYLWGIAWARWKDVQPEEAPSPGAQNLLTMMREFRHYGLGIFRYPLGEGTLSQHWEVYIGNKIT